MIETLNKFCSTYTYWSHKAIQTPFSIGKYTYATDAVVAIRVPRIKSIEKRSDAPQANGLCWSHSKVKKWELPPSRDMLFVKKCSRCNGSGKYTVCPECGGSGEVEWDTDYNTYYSDCLSCDGKVWRSDTDASCEDCMGDGNLYKKVFKVGENHVDGNRLARLLFLPELKISQEKPFKNQVLFSFDGGEGILMPLRVGGAVNNDK